MEDFFLKFLSPQNALGIIVGGIGTYGAIAKGWLPTKRQAELESALATETEKRQALERRIGVLELEIKPYVLWRDKLAEDAMNGSEK